MCLLDYEYIKNRYRLIASDLSRLKQLGADLNVIQQIELVGELKIRRVLIIKLCLF